MTLGRAPSGRRCVSLSIPHVGQPVLGPQLFFLELHQRGVVEREHAEFGVEHLLVELTVAHVERAEFRVALHPGFYFDIQTFEHSDASLQTKTPRAWQHEASWTCDCNQRLGERLARRPATLY